MRVAVVGAGSWGTTMAALVSANASNVVLWSRRLELAEAITAGHENPDYLPGVRLPD
ncbi:MAG: NAD(P)H-dependent glycerol-3-phosphate dehydrogenase, partial [Acidimicrobiia bacterium]